MTQPLTSKLQPRLTGLPTVIIEEIVDDLRAKSFPAPYRRDDNTLIASDLARLARTCRALRTPAASALLDNFAALFVDSRNFATLGLAYLDHAGQLVFLGRFDLLVEGRPALARSSQSATILATTSDTPMITRAAWVRQIRVYSFWQVWRAKLPSLASSDWQPLSGLFARLSNVVHVLIQRSCAPSVAKDILAYAPLANRVKTVSIKRPDTILRSLGTMAFPCLTQFRISDLNAYVAVTALPEMPFSAKVCIDGSGVHLSMATLLSLTSYSSIELTRHSRIVATEARVNADTGALFVGPDHARLWRATLSPSALGHFHDLVTTVGREPLRFLTHLDVNVRDDWMPMLGTKLAQLLPQLVSLRIIGGDTWDSMSLMPDQVDQLAQLPRLEILEALMCARGEGVPNPFAGQLVFRNLRRVRSSFQFFTDLRECSFPALRQATMVTPYDIWPLVSTVPVPNMPLLTSWMITGVIDETMKGKEFTKRVPLIGETVRQRVPMLAEVQLRIPAQKGWLLQNAPKLV